MLLKLFITVTFIHVILEIDNYDFPISFIILIILFSVTFVY